ncbi:MAG: protein translocase subunit SecF [Candidatus Cloacimonetes bacterium]|nr:protein translocase subunit SecF [Candidatus Cloacimonadota bacterium]MBS3766896.1 protein translocase subunit SecF [Candidatus Cloacimonadota bacterium]
MRFFKDTKIDFIGKRKIAFIISIVVIFAGIISMIVGGGLRYGIDFTGGTLMEFDLTPKDPDVESITLPEVRQVLDKHGYSDSEIQDFGNPNYILVKVKAGDDVREEETELINIFKDEFPQHAGNKTKTELIRRSEHVGAEIGEELRGKAYIAILVALLGIIIYIWWRFQFTFGLAAVIALFHDVLITVGMLSIFGKEIDIPIIGALLAIVGYSLNDTIVLFVRIREDLKIYRREGYGSVINHSINEVLSRTVVTSLTTFIVVLILFLFGGEVINPFAFTMLVGVIVGTYSSIFVASPLLYEYHSWKKKQHRHPHSKRR